MHFSNLIYFLIIIEKLIELNNKYQKMMISSLYHVTKRRYKYTQKPRVIMKKKQWLYELSFRGIAKIVIC